MIARAPQPKMRLLLMRLLLMRTDSQRHFGGSTVARSPNGETTSCWMPTESVAIVRNSSSVGTEICFLTQNPFLSPSRWMSAEAVKLTEASKARPDFDP